MALTLLGTTMIVMAIGQTAIFVPDCLMPVIKSAIRSRSSRLPLTRQNLRDAASQPDEVFYSKPPPPRYIKLILGKKSSPTASAFVSSSTSDASSVASPFPSLPPRSILKTTRASGSQSPKRSIRWGEEMMPSATEIKATRTKVEDWKRRVVLEA